jgi:hypothetical protein
MLGLYVSDHPLFECVLKSNVQIERPARFPDEHSCGALYDALAPTKEASNKDGWNHLVITARGPQITVVMNDEPIIDADLDRWTEAGKNPDGTKNKFNTALKDFSEDRDQAQAPVAHAPALPSSNKLRAAAMIQAVSSGKKYRNICHSLQAKSEAPQVWYLWRPSSVVTGMNRSENCLQDERPQSSK